MKKKLVVLLVGTMLATSLTGCNSTPTAEELMSNPYGKEEMTSGELSMLMEAEVTAKADMGGTEMSMDMAMKMDMGLQFDEDTAHVTGDLEMEMMGMKFNEEFETYVQEDKKEVSTYTLTEDQWYVEVEDADEDDKEDGVDEEVPYFGITGMDTSLYQNLALKEPEKDDKEYVVTGTIDYKDVEEAMDMDIADLLGGTNLDIDWDEIVYNMKANFDKDTKILTSMELEVDTEALKTDEFSFETLKITMTVEKINDVKVEVPKEIKKEAIEGTATEEESSDDIEINLEDVELGDGVTMEEETPDTTPSANDTQASGNWVNYEKMQFAINGKTYILGKTTLQDLIDDGVPFDENDIANAGNNVNPNASADFDIVVGEYWDCNISVLNITEENAKACDLPVVEIWLPVHEDETQNIISFDFPLTMTENDLLANAGEPTEKDEYVNENDSSYFMRTYTYEKESEKYYGEWGYEFEFNQDGLSYVNIKWLP